MKECLAVCYKISYYNNEVSTLAEIFKYFHASCLRNKVIYILTSLFLFRVLRLNRRKVSSKQDSKFAFLFITRGHVPEKEINL